MTRNAFTAYIELKNMLSIDDEVIPVTTYIRLTDFCLKYAIDRAVLVRLIASGYISRANIYQYGPNGYYYVADEKGLTQEIIDYTKNCKLKNVIKRNFSKFLNLIKEVNKE